MKYLLTFATSFVLGVFALQLVPDNYLLPPKSAVPAPGKITSAEPSNYPFLKPGNNLNLKPEYVFVAAPGASVRLPKSISEAQRAEFDRKLIQL